MSQAVVVLIFSWENTLLFVCLVVTIASYREISPLFKVGVSSQMENGLHYITRIQESMQGTHFFNENSNPELDHKVKKATEKFSENLQIIANEPSLAFFRIQEHVRKSLPQLIDKKQEVQEIQQQVQGRCFDTEYAINAVRGMQRSTTHFQNVQDLLKNAMFMKQQIQYEQSRRAYFREQEKLRPSMYRTMMRTNTVDIPVSSADRNAEFTRSAQLAMPGPSGGSPRARSSSLTTHDKKAKRPKSTVN